MIAYLGAFFMLHIEEISDTLHALVGGSFKQIFVGRMNDCVSD